MQCTINKNSKFEKCSHTYENCTFRTVRCRKGQTQRRIINLSVNRFSMVSIKALKSGDRSHSAQKEKDRKTKRGRRKDGSHKNVMETHWIAIMSVLMFIIATCEKNSLGQARYRCDGINNDHLVLSRALIQRTQEQSCNVGIFLKVACYINIFTQSYKYLLAGNREISAE